MPILFAAFFTAAANFFRGPFAVFLAGAGAAFFGAGFPDVFLDVFFAAFFAFFLVAMATPVKWSHLMVPLFPGPT